MTQPSGGEMLNPQGLQLYRDGDEPFFLAAAVGAMRDFCGWHLAPVEAVTNEQVEAQNGLIVLRTLHLLDVVKVQLGGQVLDASQYEASEAGYITVPTAWGEDGQYAQVSYTHGYAQLPRNVLVIGYELAQRAQR